MCEQVKSLVAYVNCQLHLLKLGYQLFLRVVTLLYPDCYRIVNKVVKGCAGAEQPYILNRKPSQTPLRFGEASRWRVCFVFSTVWPMAFFKSLAKGPLVLFCSKMLVECTAFLPSSLSSMTRLLGMAQQSALSLRIVCGLAK